MVVVTDTKTGTTLVRDDSFESGIRTRCTLIHDGYNNRLYADPFGNRYRVSKV